MPDDADRYRKRAAACRQVAESGPEGPDRRALNDMADDLDAEADSLDELAMQMRDIGKPSAGELKK